MRIAVIGAGPAGFYACDQLLGAGFEVDLLDMLPTPFGLVRSGVAPDHPKIKTVTRAYEKTARKPGFRFFGGVTLGEHVSRAELLERYDAVLYAFGTADDNRLGIPGEDRLGSYPATRFVAWYNGHPDAIDESFDLSAQRAVVIGNGNVATDVARMLLLDPDELAITDTADHALGPLSAGQVQEVVILGRRGPAQAAFTNPELRELGEMEGVDVQVDPAEVDGIEIPEDASPTVRRNVEILQGFAARPRGNAGRRISLKFLRSPVELLGEGDDGPVTGIRVALNRLEDGRAVPTGEEEVIGCGLVFRAIGYRGRPIDDIPFDAGRGLIRNDGGRVCDEEGRPHAGEYAVGWIKRGPSGVIGTNKKDAADTVAKVVADAEAGRLGSASDADDCAEWISRCAPDAVVWEGWQAIDEQERRAGEPQGRPRVKLVRLDELVAAGRSVAR